MTFLRENNVNSDKIILHSKFNGSSGSSNFADSSKFNCQATIAGTVTLTDTYSVLGLTSLNMDSTLGNQIYFSLPNVSTYNGNFTIEFWYRPSTSNVGVHRSVFTFGDESGGDYAGPTIYNDGNFWLYGNSNYETFSWTYGANTPIPDTLGEWKHVSLASDGINVYFYLNGRLAYIMTSNQRDNIKLSERLYIARNLITSVGNIANFDNLRLTTNCKYFNDKAYIPEDNVDGTSIYSNMPFKKGLSSFFESNKINQSAGLVTSWGPKVGWGSLSPTNGNVSYISNWSGGKSAIQSTASLGGNGGKLQNTTLPATITSNSGFTYLIVTEIPSGMFDGQIAYPISPYSPVSKPIPFIFRRQAGVLNIGSDIYTGTTFFSSLNLNSHVGKKCIIAVMHKSTSQRISIYIEGVGIFSESFSNSQTLTQITGLTVGASDGTDNGFPFPIAMVAIYNEPANNSELEELCMWSKDIFSIA